MSVIKDILIDLETNQKQYEQMGLENRDSYINLGWLECARFISDNYDVKEKTINKGD